MDYEKTITQYETNVQLKRNRVQLRVEYAFSLYRKPCSDEPEYADFKTFVIYKGQKFEADVAYIDIYQQATTSIYVVDDYMNVKTLQLLSQKKQGVEVVLFTENGHGRNGFLTATVVKDFCNQYPSLCIKSNPDCHDRWIILDYGLSTEQVYHCGASSKDAGKKLCAINKIENVSIIHSVIDKLLLGEDKTIA